MKKTLALITAIVLALVVRVTPEAVPRESKAEAWQPQQLSFEVVEREWPRCDLLIKDEAGAELARIDWFNGYDRGPAGEPTCQRIGEGPDYMVHYLGSLGGGSGMWVYGNRRWRVLQNSDCVQVQDLPDQVTSSGCTWFDKVDGVEYEITSELQGTPGNYEWVEVSRST